MKLFGAHGERLELFGQEVRALGPGGRGPLAHAVADSRHGLHEPLLFEHHDRLLHRVGIDAILGAERADGGKGVAGLELSGDDRLARGVEHLLIDRHACFEVDREEPHVYYGA